MIFIRTRWYCVHFNIMTTLVYIDLWSHGLQSFIKSSYFMYLWYWTCTSSCSLFLVMCHTQTVCLFHVDIRPTQTSPFPSPSKHMIHEQQDRITRQQYQFKISHHMFFHHSWSSTLRGKSSRNQEPFTWKIETTRTHILISSILVWKIGEASYGLI